MSDGLSCNKIMPPINGKKYLGIFAPQKDHESPAVTMQNIAAFEALSGTEVDISLIFISLLSGPLFPTRQARAMAKKGSTVFVKIEPWDPSPDKKKINFLRAIINGKYDRDFKRFAYHAQKFMQETGKSFFLSFGHEMNFDKSAWAKKRNVNSYPWAGNPDLYKKAYIHVYKLMSKMAPGITWVWNINVDAEASAYYPGDQYVDWVALDGYDTTGKRGTEHLFNGNLQDPKNPKILTYLKSLKKPIMIGEFACGKDNPQCLTDFLDFTANDPAIAGIVYFNRDKEDSWAITQPKEQQAWSKAMQKHIELFQGAIEQAPCQEK